MKNGFKAMDSDMHVFEPADLWQRYIDKKYLDRAPKGLNTKPVHFKPGRRRARHALRLPATTKNLINKMFQPEYCRGWPCACPLGNHKGLPLRS